MADVMALAPEADFSPRTEIDWAEVARLVTISRALDELEETRLVPEKKILYQFSARGHDLAQVILGMHLRDGDAACGCEIPACVDLVAFRKNDEHALVYACSQGCPVGAIPNGDVACVDSPDSRKAAAHVNVAGDGARGSLRAERGY